MHSLCACSPSSLFNKHAEKYIVQDSKPGKKHPINLFSNLGSLFVMKACPVSNTNWGMFPIPFLGIVDEMSDRKLPFYFFSDHVCCLHT